MSSVAGILSTARLTNDIMCVYILYIYIYYLYTYYYYLYTYYVSVLRSVICPILVLP